MALGELARLAFDAKRLAPCNEVTVTAASTLPDMDEQRWRERMERYERAVLAVVMAGSLMAGVLFREEAELHIHMETGPIPTTIDSSSPIVTGSGWLY